MKITELFKTAYISLKANKGRSVLTMLGVIIGVSAVILLISLGRGIQNYITDQFEILGSNLIFISPGKFDLGKDPSFAISRNKLERKHIKLIEEHATNFVDEISPFMGINETVKFKTKTYSASIVGVDYNYTKITNFEIATGRTFTKQEVKSKSKVAIIGRLIAENLFPNRNPIGQKIKIGKHKYEIIGTFKEKGQSFDEVVRIPYTSAQSSFDIDNYTSIVLKATDENNMDKAVSQIKKALLRDLSEDEFTILLQGDILESIQNVLRILTIGLGAIAGISLFVGGIGIMNIMLVSVTERTREIGIRKAIGATSNDIAIQFVIESMLLSVGGGVIGILLGWISSFGARSLIRTEVPWWAVLLAFSFAALVGIIFGTYPAVKAAKKDPIEALRYE